MIEILLGDCIEVMQSKKSGEFDLIFADPPFNLGFEYTNYEDNRPVEAYMRWCREWMEEAQRVLSPTGSMWIASHDTVVAEHVVAMKELGFHLRSWVIWTYSFGVNCKSNFTKSHTHLVYFTRDKKKFTFNADDESVRHPSARQLVYKDKRASASRLPDDTWCLLKAQLDEQAKPMDDTWFESRVCGTFKERLKGHSCQMPESVLERIIRTCSSQGGKVLDPFGGTFTTSAVCKRLGRNCLSCDISPEYVRIGTERINKIQA